MVEVNRDLAVKVFSLLEDGWSPYAIEKEAITSVRTAQRLSAAWKGFATLSTDGLIEATGWVAQRVDALRRFYAEHLRATRGPELGRHHRRLYAFGRRLRDRLFIPRPQDLAQVGGRGMSIVEGSGATMWTRDLTAIELTHLGADQEEVEGEWGADFYDARTHSLYPLFQQHLVDSPGWVIIDQLNDQFSAFVEQCGRASDRLRMEVGRQLPALQEWGVDAMVNSVLQDGYDREVFGGSGVDFTYERQRVVEGDKLSWYLRLGSWRVGGEDDHEPFDLVADVHSSMVKVVATDPALAGLWPIGIRARKMVSDIRAALGPPAMLESRVAEGVCRACRDMVKVTGAEATRQHTSVRTG